ncbi:hypothetical protein EDD17DRAFT_453319 [Pisolithus thermaeus]|nr:hypothetical protein EDD17DRAFT_453319 [Pisolithus thermaeus]
MCILLIGTPSLERFSDIIEHPDPTQWKELRGLLVDRTSNINVVASLALSTCASFLTTSSPTDIANWSHPFPYLCILAGAVFALLSVLSGVGLLGFINAVQPNTVRVCPNFPFLILIAYDGCRTTPSTFDVLHTGNTVQPFKVCIDGHITDNALPLLVYIRTCGYYRMSRCSLVRKQPMGTGRCHDRICMVHSNDFRDTWFDLLDDRVLRFTFWLAFICIN